MNILFILSAKLVSVDLRYRFGEIPSAMLPFDNNPILFTQYERFSEYYDKIYVIVGERQEIISDYVKNKNWDKLEVLVAKDYSSLQMTIMNTAQLEHIFYWKNVSILFGDTLVGLEDVCKCIDKNSILTSKVQDSSRWTIIKSKSIIDKKIVDFEPPYDAICGFFNFTNYSLLINYLKVNDFYNAISLLMKERYDISFIESQEWIDLGHEDNYLKVKKNKSRAFNHLQIDFQRGKLLKKSSNKEKLINEISWYLNIPNDVSYLSPRIFSYSLNKENPYVEMEYYSYDTLHEVYLFSNLTYIEWKHIYSTLFNRLSDLDNYMFNPGFEVINNSLHSMYFDKVVSRLSELRKSKEFNFLLSGPFFINGIKISSIESIMDIFKETYKLLRINDLSDFTVIHGDYFFANILYDIKNDIVRLIDPRGEFGVAGIYGDRRYDYAKLLHSVHGKYDLIVEDMYRLECSGNSYNYTIYANENQLRAENALIDVFNEKKIDILPIKFIESSLFLSMAVLHTENTDRQKVMLFQGIELLNNIIKEIKNDKR